jgi:hypothetical protein
VARDRFIKVQEQGVSFVFKCDPDAPELLHIYARHLTTIDDALDVFFDLSATQAFNDERERFERRNRTHELYWFWLNEPKVVMVVTCFRLEGKNGKSS